MDSVARILELIVDFLKRNYKKPKLWFGILGILVFIILIFPYIDSNTFYYTRMEKRISILEHLTQLDETAINSNPVYRQEYESILQEIQLQRERSVNSIATQLFDTVNSSWTTGKDQGNKILKFISGAIWFLIVTICVPFMNTFKKRSDKLVAFIVMIILVRVAIQNFLKNIVISMVSGFRTTKFLACNFIFSPQIQGDC